MQPPRSVRVADESEVLINQRTQHKEVEIQGQRAELRLYVMSTSSVPIILIISWLEKHNPSIELISNEGTFGEKLVLKEPPVLLAVPEMSTAIPF